MLFFVGYFSFIKNSLINFYMVCVFSLGIIFVIPYLNPKMPFRYDTDFSFLVSWGLIGFIFSFFILSLLKKPQLNKERLSPLYSRKKCRRNILSLLAIASISLIWIRIFFVVPSLRIEDITNVILRDRIREYQQIALEYGHFLNFLLLFLMIPLYLETFRLLKKRNRLAWLYYATIICDILFFSHTRFVLIMWLVIPFIYRHFFLRPLSFRFLTSLLVLSMLLVSLLNITRGGLFLKSINPIESRESIIKNIYRQFTRAGAGSTVTFYRLYNGIQEGQIDIEYGKQYLINLYKPIPRRFWPEKPITSYFWRLTEDLEGRLPGPGQKVLTSTIFGEAYHQFGWVGVFFFPSIFMLTLYFFVSFLSKYENTEFLIWMTMIRVPMSIRGGLDSTISKLIQIVIIFFLLSIIIYRKNRCLDLHNPLKELFPF